jgi:hypothetical protein
MLGLCDSLGCQIKLLFQGPGMPLVAEPHFVGRDGVRLLPLRVVHFVMPALCHTHAFIHYILDLQEVDYEAELIVATLTDGLDPLSSQPVGGGYGTGAPAGHNQYVHPGTGYDEQRQAQGDTPCAEDERRQWDNSQLRAHPRSPLVDAANDLGLGHDINGGGAFG